MKVSEYSSLYYANPPHAHWNSARCQQKNCVPAANDLAYVLACSADEKLRDGPRAIKLAERAAELTKRDDAGVLRTLSAAYANGGRFDDALAASREALVLAERKGRLELAENIRQRMELYTAGKPYRHVPRPSP